MSGFITIYNTDNKPVQPRLLSSLVESLKFRGPDKQKIWIDGNIGMGHTLFKTTFEAEYEKQPATIDRQVWITCSARIDDRKNLVNKLGMKKEIDLNKTPDSELILYAYKKWDEDCLEHLLGDFAFVIWDNRNKKIFCARDRFGMRQLYYAHKKNSLIIGNSIKCLLQHPNITSKFNDKSIAGFLLFGDHHWLDLALTAFQDVSALKPAHSLTFQNGKKIISKYWDISLDRPLIHYKHETDYIEHFLELFEMAVSDRIRTPSIVIAMSGGMDSSTIAAIAQQIDIKKPFNLQAITAIYEKLLPDKEPYYADLVAKKLGIPIKFINGDKFPFIKSELTTTSPTQLISPDFWLEFNKVALQYSRVTLAGYAGDSLLSYSPVKSLLKELSPFYIFTQLIQMYQKYDQIPSLGLGIMKRFNKIFHKQDETNILYPSWIKPEFEKRLSLKEFWEDNNYMWEHSSKNYSRHPNAYMSLTHANWNTDDYIYESSITFPEIRDPFLDSRIVEYLFSLPSLPWFYKKHILRESMKTVLPPEIIKRPKTPIGNLSHIYLTQHQNEWVDHWEPLPELLDYVEFKKIPTLAGGANRQTDSYLNLRPLYLNSWINNIR